MPALQDKLTRAFWSVDRMLGGQEPPTRSQRFSARHPIGIGVCTGVPIAILGAATTLEDHGSWGDVLIAGGFGAAIGIVFGLTALGERYRQRRLQRLGLWSAPRHRSSGDG